MGKKDPRVDEYIAKSADFAKPILKHLRKTVHAACPAVEEDIKWGVPHFMYNGILCSMAAFKQHCAFGFWKQQQLVEKHKSLGAKRDDAAGQLGRITSISDLPPVKILTKYIQDAGALNEAEPKSSRPKRAKKPAPQMPAELRSALQSNKKAQAAFAAFSPSHQREYIEWITEAKRDETRRKRIATAVEWIAAGKPRNWKYM